MAIPDRSRAAVPSRLLEFLRTEEGSGALLLVATVIALLWANSPLADLYEGLWGAEATITIGTFSIEKDLQHWVNDGLMTLFFLVVGLEIKREVTSGELREPRKLALPVIAAIGGMIVPAGIYLLLNAGGETSSGWGIPVATDIAFALGVLTIVASRAPVSVRSFLLTLAIVDDVGAVILIAVLYSGGVETGPMLAAAAILAGVEVLRFVGFTRVGPYVILGVALWVAFEAAGIHPTIAGVVLGLLTPAGPIKPLSAPRFWQGRRAGHESEPDTNGSVPYSNATDEARFRTSPLDRVESTLHPWTSRFVVPVFALANAGVAVGGGLLAETVTSPVGLGVFLGLVVGKPVGIATAVWAATRTGLGRLPDDFAPSMVVGVGALAGVGFTVSLFIADLAFEQPLVDTAKLAVLGASLVASIIGASILRASGRDRPNHEHPGT